MVFRLTITRYRSLEGEKNSHREKGSRYKMAKELDKRGFVFIDDRLRPFWVGLWDKEPWMFYWHPDRKWVSFRRVTQADVFAFSVKRIPEVDADIYHRQHVDNGYSLEFGGPDRTCRECGCTDDDCRRCIEATGKPCRWVEADLCSRCKDEMIEAGNDVLEAKHPEIDEFKINGPAAAR